MANTRLAHCPHCNAARHFRKRSLNHLIHLAATAFTFGLWSLPWLSVTIHYFRKPWRCSYCGSRMPRATSPEPGGRIDRASAREATAPW